MGAHSLPCGIVPKTWESFIHRLPIAQVQYPVGKILGNRVVRRKQHRQAFLGYDLAEERQDFTRRSSIQVAGW